VIFTDVTLPPDPSSVRLAREQLRSAATGMDPSRVESAALALSEIASNAVIHAGGPFRLLVDVSGPLLHVEVHDPSREGLTMQPLPLDPAAVSGRGLRIVSEMADRWGTARTDGGKVVWFELDDDPR
jgi:anti-sigma regulatory factor (Ser/Thr protein kinase)